MLTITEFKHIYNQIKNEFVNEDDDGPYQIITEFLTQKFLETSNIFNKLDRKAMNSLCSESFYEIYEENQPIFNKGEECLSYYFVVYGDINLYEEEVNLTNKTNNKLLKTLSAGTVYGHKIKSNFNYYSVAKNLVHLIKISKECLDNIIAQTNKRKDETKLLFLKKFFPKLRMYSEDVIDSLKGYFIREEYEKDIKVLADTEYDEFVYLIIKGSLAIVKSVVRLNGLKEKLNESNCSELVNARYVVLEKLSRGDIFGVYSALKHQKNNYTVYTLTDKTEVYKISKSHCLYYFGGSSGVIPESLKGLDSVQQVSIHNKINFLLHNEVPKLKLFEFLPNSETLTNGKKIIDESEIVNCLKDAWKKLENLGTELSEFKTSLLKNNKKPTGDIFSKLKAQESEGELKDHTKLNGFATNRVVGKNINRNGLNSQLKGYTALQNICGIKKDESESKIIEKISTIKKIEDGGSKNKLFSEFEENNDKDANVINISSDKKPNNEQSKPKKIGFSLKKLI